MFERRLKTLLVFFALAVVALLVRIAQLQAIHGEDYRKRAEQLLVRPQQFIPTSRGAILDRTGRPLAWDEPAWDVCVDYGLVSENDAYRRKVAGRIDLDFDDPANRSALNEHIERIWQRISRATGAPESELYERCNWICSRVARIKRVVNRRAREAAGIAHDDDDDYEVIIREERMAHPIVQGLDDQTAVDARFALVGIEDVSVNVSTARKMIEHPAWPHVLGRLARVDADDLDTDPFADDSLKKLLASGQVGKRGLEQLLEPRLRGRRGESQKDREDHVINRVEPIAGEDVRISLDRALQERIYAILGDAIEHEPDGYATGGAAVVLDIDTRETLALVSYPGYLPDVWEKRPYELIDDTKNEPFRFRAVANAYAPGSPCKAIVLVGALAEGVIDLGHVETCSGYLFPDVQNAWRCWRPAGSTIPMRHGLMGCEDSIKHSCNIFYYRVGEMLDVSRLAEWLWRFGIGRSPGTGLVEEVAGICPTPQWIAANRERRASKGDARNYALGQGEVTATPLQQANLIATLASGVYQSPTLLLDDQGPREYTVLPVRPEVWAAVRRGLWKVVNETGGTAASAITFDSPDYELCGKSGSAQTQPVPLSYDVTYKVGEVEKVARIPGRYRRDVDDAFRRRFPELSIDAIVSRTPAEWWPFPRTERKTTPSHAWFVAYVQPKSVSAVGGGPSVAIAVLVEYGGSGGKVAGPVVGQIAQLIHDEFPQYLRASGRRVARESAASSDRSAAIAAGRTQP